MQSPMQGWPHPQLERLLVDKHRAGRPDWCRARSSAQRAGQPGPSIAPGPMGGAGDYQRKDGIQDRSNHGINPHDQEGDPALVVRRGIEILGK